MNYVITLQENIRFATMSVLGNLMVVNINIINYHLTNWYSLLITGEIRTPPKKTMD